MTLPDAPLPDLSATVRDGSNPANDWRRFVDSAPIHAEWSLFQQTFVLTKRSVFCSRSVFRSGTIRFDADGITISGMATKMPTRRMIHVFVGTMITIVFLQYTGAAARFHLISVIPTSVQNVFSVLAMISPFFSVLWTRLIDKRRTEATMLLDWQSVRGLQVDKHLRCVTLIFWGFTTPGVVRKTRPFPNGDATGADTAAPLRPCEYLTLGKLSPPVVEAVAATILHFAPHIERETVTAYQMPHALAMVLWSIGAIGLIVLAVVGYIYWIRLHP